jgi:serine/threonine protein kinase
MHARGIVHRDVKPANIMIGHDDVVTVTDFGIAVVDTDPGTSDQLVAGTPHYIAPELARGGVATAAADVFSLGATLYTCLEGEPPFGMAGNSLQQLHRVAAGVINPPHASGALTEPLLAMLAVDPQERPSMTEVRDQLAAIAAGSGGDTTTVLNARTDVARTRPQQAGVLPPPPRTLVEADRPAETDAEPAAGPVAEPASPPPPPDDRRRRTVLPWVAAAVLLVLVGLGAVWAAIANDPAGNATEAPPSSSSAAESSSPPSDEPSKGSSAPEPSDSSEKSSSSSAAESSSDDGGDTTLDAKNAEDLLAQYHELVFDDPAAAYEQAGPTLRSAISLEGYEDYWNDFTDVTLSDVEVEDGGDSALATMEFDYPDGSTQVERHRFTFIEQDGKLVLDSDRFVEMIQGRS